MPHLQRLLTLFPFSYLGSERVDFGALKLCRNSQLRAVLCPAPGSVLVLLQCRLTTCRRGSVETGMCTASKRDCCSPV